MKVIYNKYLPYKTHSAMTILWWLFIRKEYKESPQLNDEFWLEEWIHSQQQIEILGASTIIIMAIVGLFNISAWWLLLAFALPLIIYAVCWVIEIILPPYNSAYSNVCFESEAQYNRDKSYYAERKPFAWIKYISNNKYPTINI